MTKESIQLVKQISPAQAIEYYTHQQPKHGKYICPFHNDKHPSLTVKNGHWQCWSCNEHGDVISFVQKYHGIGFIDAVKRIADDFGITLPESMPPTNPLDKLWQSVERESREHNQRELAAYRESIDQEIDTLTAAHRALLHYGAPEDYLQQLGAEIDDLIAYRNAI